MVKFQVGDIVAVLKFHKAGAAESEGRVLEVVPKGTYPTEFPRYHKGRQLGTRTEESYIVETTDGERCWPLMRRLRAKTMTPPAVVTQAATPIVTTTTVEETRPDGSVVRKTIVEEVVKAAPPQLDTDFIIVLDTSGSMMPCRDGAIRAFNNEIATIRESARTAGLPEPRVSFWLFGEGRDPQRVYDTLSLRDGVTPRCLYDRRLVTEVPVLDRNNYLANGPSTPLWDGVGMAVEAFLRKPEAGNPNQSVVLHVITDGMENASTKFNAASVRELLARAAGSDRWSFAFMVPPGYRTNFAANSGIEIGNIIEWENTNAGAAVAEVKTKSAVGSYMRMRSAGAKAVKNFYLQPDLSKLKAEDLAKLRDFSNAFRVHKVEQEAPIKEFVEGVVKVSYVIGSGYYQLVKKEKVQGHKSVLLRDRFTHRIYGGLEARRLIGLPYGQDATIEPGNHAQFDIFLESDSINRILPRGSLLLHDYNQKIDKQPTWDHTAVAQVQQ